MANARLDNCQPMVEEVEDDYDIQVKINKLRDEYEFMKTNGIGNAPMDLMMNYNYLRACIRMNNVILSDVATPMLH